MTIVFVILIILASAILGLIVLIQNPKGGGLAGNIAGFSNQFMGVKQTTDVLEKGTWIFAGVIAVLCITSSVFISGKSTRNINITAPGAPAGNTTTQPGTLPVGPGTNTTTPPPAIPDTTPR
jgi:preprotein translocase subunit SecG